jgi:hypothetical protein
MHSGLMVMVMYSLLVILGNFLAWRIGIVVENNWPVLSLPIFLSMFFGVLILAWPIAVWITEKWGPSEERVPAGAKFATK